MTQPEAVALVAKWMTNFHPGESLVEGVARQLCGHVGELQMFLDGALKSMEEAEASEDKMRKELTTAQELARLGGWRE